MKLKKFATRKGDDYTTGCLLDYQYFKDHYKIIALDPRAVQQTDYTTGDLLDYEYFSKHYKLIAIDLSKLN